MSISFDKLPDNQALAKMVIQVHSEHETTRMQQGWLGRAFGDISHKPGNLAGFVVLLGFVLLFALFLFPTSPIADKVATGCIALITLALGYIFGKHH